MADERKPLTDFRATKAANGGWIITQVFDDYVIPASLAYSSDHDMLAALPELIGVRDDRDRERGKQWYFATMQQNLRTGDGYESGD
jgi:hypothetical protein